MAIWTSRYSNKELVENKDKYYCVGISLGTPKFPLGYTVEQQCYSLAPKGNHPNSHRNSPISYSQELRHRA